MEINDFITSSLGYTFLISLIIFLYIWIITKIPDYWKEKGVPRVKPVRFFGAVLENIKKPLHENELERYRTLGPVYGYHQGSKKVMSIGDPELIRDILVKDFQYFTDRKDVAASGDTISEFMLQHLKGEEWKRVRTIITPTFTTGKIKRMMHIFKKCSQVLIANFKAFAEKGEPVDVKSLYGALTMDVIASAAFSTKLDSHNDPENKFVQTARNVFQKNISWRVILYQLFPRLVKLFKIEYYPPDDLKFFKNVTLQIIKERKRTGQKGNDFLQLLMDTAEEKRDELESLDKKDDILSNYESETNDQIFKNYVLKRKELSFDELVANCVIFFLAGYETTASTLSFVTYQLALNKDIQEKLIKEIDEAIKNCGGKLTYEVIQNMKYLDNVISESLRLSPPAVKLQRISVMDYQLKDTNIIIPKDTQITIPVYAIQRDAKYWPDPEKFHPDRFTLEQRANRSPYTFMPFGYGPRICVGMRFALVEIKVCLAYVLSNFRIEKCPETKVPLEFNVNQILLHPKEIFVKLVQRSDSPLNE